MGLGEISNLKNLRRLGILKLHGEKGMHVSSTLEKLKHLTCLLLSSTSNTEPLCLGSLSSPPLLLQRLFLKGDLESLPSWIFCLKYLGKLVLQYSRLKDDPIRALQGFHNLVMLDLRDAFLGEELSCDIGGYPKLKQLFLRQLGDLKRVVFTQGAMPMLRELEISDCQNLQTVPAGTEHLKDLGYLLLSHMPSIFIKNINKRNGHDFWKVEHVGIIQVFS